MANQETNPHAGIHKRLWILIIVIAAIVVAGVVALIYTRNQAGTLAYPPSTPLDQLPYATLAFDSTTISEQDLNSATNFWANFHAYITPHNYKLGEFNQAFSSYIPAGDAFPYQENYTLCYQHADDNNPSQMTWSEKQLFDVNDYTNASGNGYSYFVPAMPAFSEGYGGNQTNTKIINKEVGGGNSILVNDWQYIMGGEMKLFVVPIAGSLLPGNEQYPLVDTCEGFLTNYPDYPTTTLSLGGSNDGQAPTAIFQNPLKDAQPSVFPSYNNFFRATLTDKNIINADLLDFHIFGAGVPRDWTDIGDGAPNTSPCYYLSKPGNTDVICDLSKPGVGFVPSDDSMYLDAVDVFGSRSEVGSINIAAQLGPVSSLNDENTPPNVTIGLEGDNLKITAHDDGVGVDTNLLYAARDDVSQPGSFIHINITYKDGTTKTLDLSPLLTIDNPDRKNATFTYPLGNIPTDFPDAGMDNQDNIASVTYTAKIMDLKYRITLDPSKNNTALETFTQTANTDGPTFSAFNPAKGATNVPLDTAEISYEITDDTGIDGTSIAFLININGTYEDYTDRLTTTYTQLNSDRQLKVTISTVGIMPCGQTMDLQVAAADYSGNTGSDTWSFTTASCPAGDTTPPNMSMIVPNPTTDVALDTNIITMISDPESVVDCAGATLAFGPDILATLPSQTNIQRNQAGSGQLCSLVFDPTADLQSNTTYRVTLTASSTGGSTTKDFRFTTGDGGISQNAPVISLLYPIVDSNHGNTIDPGAGLVFEIKDNNAAIDQASITLDVNGNAVTPTAITTGTCTDTAAANAACVFYDPNPTEPSYFDRWPLDSTITYDISAKDGDGEEGTLTGNLKVSNYAQSDIDGPINNRREIDLNDFLILSRYWEEPAENDLNGNFEKYRANITRPVFGEYDSNFSGQIVDFNDLLALVRYYTWNQTY